MSKWLKMILFMFCGAVVMAACLLWVSQFFTRGGDVGENLYWIVPPEGDADGDQWNFQ